MKIKGTALWASVLAPNTKFDPVWSIDLVIEDGQVAGAKKAGLKVKKTDDGNVVRFRRNVNRSDGGENKPPVVVDIHRNPQTVLVGNGSLVNVQFSVFEWSNKFGTGTGVDLQGVQVLSLVEFAGGDGSEFEDEAPDEEIVSKPAAKVEFDEDDLPDVL